MKKFMVLTKRVITFKAFLFVMNQENLRHVHKIIIKYNSRTGWLEKTLKQLVTLYFFKVTKVFGSINSIITNNIFE